MNKQMAVELLILLSALDAWAVGSKNPIPDYLHDSMRRQCETLGDILTGTED